MNYPTAYSHWDEYEAEAIARVLHSRQYTMHDEVAAFEEELADYHGMRHCVMVNSGSSANLLMIAALFHMENPLKRGDRVIVPALAWATTYAPLVQHGLDIVLADAGPSWNVVAERQDDVVYADDKIELIIGCSVLGNPANLEMMARGTAACANAYFIEDNCESLGARTHDGNLTGTFGLMNSFSFFHSHQISAIEGGAVLTNDDECARLCRLLRNHGNAGFLKKTPEYDFVLHGYNLRPLELHAAIAREQLRKLDGFIAARRCNAAFFADLVEGLPIVLPERTGEQSPFGLQFTVASPTVRDRLVLALRAQEIDCRPPTGGSFRLHAYGRPWSNQLTPMADHIHRTGLFLGNAPYDISDKIEEAVAIMREIL